MKVVCIDNFTVDIFSYHSGEVPSEAPFVDINLTIGKSYEVIKSSSYDFSSNDSWIQIIDDIGTKRLYSSKLFVDTEEYRNEKLKELGI